MTRIGGHQPEIMILEKKNFGITILTVSKTASPYKKARFCVNKSAWFEPMVPLKLIIKKTLNLIQGKYKS